MAPQIHQPDPRLDLAFERTVGISPELIWAAWTTPAHIKHWFTPSRYTQRQMDDQPLLRRKYSLTFKRLKQVLVNFME